MRNLIVLVAIALSSSFAISADTAATRMKIEQALGGDNRSEAEVARDANRKPAEVLEFF
jgi:predicted methyltransferase